MSLAEFDCVKRNEPMSAHTTFRVGGAADYFAEPVSEEEAAALLDAAKQEGIPVTVTGNGSNLLVRDGGIRGLVLHMGRGFADVSVTGGKITARSGALLSQVANIARKNGLSGLEFAAGIPGSVGGGVYMNAGAYGGSLSDVLVSVRAITDGGVRTFAAGECDFGYRHSVFCENRAVIVGAEFELMRAPEEEIADRMRSLAQKRAEKQPLEYPSAGSTFKRPEGHFAGALIEQTGLKGFSVGAAQVSEKHAGFVINRGGATAAELLELIFEVQRRVFEHTGVRLEPEVRIIGEEA